MNEVEDLADVEERYEVLQQSIGAGGQGVLFVGRDRRTGGKVALKAQKPWTLEPKSLFGEIGDELATEGAHTHLLSDIEEIPDVFATGWYRGRRCIVLEFVEGKVLQDVVSSKRPIKDPASTASIVAQLCEILHAVHERGLVHCDVKPENVLVEADGRLRLIDMGLAITTGVPTTESRGTPGYVPPEQLDDRPQGLHPTADIFALGCMLLEMTVMRLPYAGMEGRPTPECPVLPPDHLAAVPAAFRELALQMVELDAGRRPADVREVLDRLRRYLPTPRSRRPAKPLSPDPTEYYRSRLPRL
ncbi:serine/threonine protein kinase [Streptomyces qinglanensis]|uniref:serine/threonine protein kinase n=1 Tax=Streptomyces qinglanensis TaxID=943816 RepID=UPI003D70BC0B